MLKCRFFSGINRDIQSMVHAELESEGELSDGDHNQPVQQLPGGKFYRQMSEQVRSTSRKTRTYPPKEASPVAEAPRPKPPVRSKVQVAALEVHNVKKAINR